MEVTGYYSTEDSLITSDGVVRKEPPYLSWLIGQRANYHVAYHLDHFVACFGRLIGLDDWEAKKLVKTGKLKAGIFSLDYIPGKFFSIKQGYGKGRPFFLISDASKFLEETFTDDVNEGIQKAVEAQMLGASIARALVSLGLVPSTLVSPIRAWEKERMGALELPTDNDMPDEVGQWAYEACKGNWVEAFSRGHWDMAYDWDINSAYPFFALNLPYFTKDDWIKDYDLNPRARVGIYKCIVETEAPFHPMMFKTIDDENFTPVGKWQDSLSLNMIRHITDYGLGKVRILDGYCLDPSKDYTRPLFNTMIDLYKIKNESSGIKREVVKRIMSGIYGKFLEVRREGFGPNFNPVYGMEIESNTRIEVSRFCLDNKIVPLHVAVDGVLTDKDLDMVSVSTIGGWRLASSSPALVIGTGQVAIKDKEGAGEFSLDYDYLMEHKDEAMTKLSPMTLAKSVNLNRTADIGILEVATRSLNLNSETKRCYKTEVLDWEDLMGRQETSIPWDISVVTSMKAEV